MIRNVGQIDRLLRFILGIALLWFGLIRLNGIGGEAWGVFIALLSLIPFYMSLSAFCILFKWIKVHSLSPKECAKFGEPYQ